MQNKACCSYKKQNLRLDADAFQMESGKPDHIIQRLKEIPKRPSGTFCVPMRKANATVCFLPSLVFLEKLNSAMSPVRLR